MATEAPRPVPRPRRTIVVTAEPAQDLEDVNQNKAYENVTISVDDKPEKDKNKDRNSSSTPSPSPSTSSSSSSTSPSSIDEVDLQNNNRSKLDVRNPYSSVLMEIDQLKLSDESASPSAVPVKQQQDKPKPAPRSRTKQPQPPPMQYENTELKKPPRRETRDVDKQNNNTATTTTTATTPPAIIINSSTGAIKKQPTRSAPPRPPSPVFRSKTTEAPVPRTMEEISNGEKLTRSSSSNTLDSSQDGSEASAKYKTSSPGQILKSIGASSRLLTEAITERVSEKTKGARKKIMKTSKETLFTISSETTSTLKNVRKKINTRMSNMSLGKHSGSREDIPDLDRPITLPPESGTAFSGIQFNSPLSGKTKNSYDLTDSTYEVPNKRHSSHLTTKGNSELSIECPSYEEAVRSSVSSQLNESCSPLPQDFERNITGLTQSMMSSVGERPKLMDKDEVVPLTRRKSETNLDSSSSPEIDIPCPNFPAPILSLSPVYGKINKKNVTISSSDEEEEQENNNQAISIPPPPIRHRQKTKRQQQKDGDVEEEKEDVRACSHRATVDPNEYKREKRIYPRLDAKKLLPEKETSKCDSWAFYDTVSKDEILSPIKSPGVDRNEMKKAEEERRKLVVQSYENVEPRYGTVFSADDEEEKRKREQMDENILLEFDPLMGGSGSSMASELLKESGKSNHLLLLETLLSQETYGTVQGEEEEDDTIGNTTDDESLNAALDDEEELEAPVPPSRQESLVLKHKEEEEEMGQASSSKVAVVKGKVKDNKKGKDKPAEKEEKVSNKRPVMIIHQNSNLRSESMENIVDEREMERYLVRTGSSVGDHQDGGNATERQQESPAPVPSSSSSSAFYIDQNRPRSELRVAAEQEKEKQKKVEENVPLEPPPSYQEVLKEKAEQEASTSSGSKTPEPQSSHPGNISTTNKKSSMISKFSNVFNRSLIRRGSLKSSSKPEVKTVLEMIARPLPSSESHDYEGHLVRYPTGVVEDILKEIQFRHTTIRNRTFYTFLNSEHKNPKESFPVDEVTTVQSILNQKMTNGQTDIHCFEVTVEVCKSHSNQSTVASNPNLVLTASASGNSKATRVCHVYGCVKQSERSVWMQKLLENMTDVFPKTATQDYKRAGWCYMKNSISANWSGAWLLLQRRKLLFHYAGKLDVLDLRKARCIVLKEADESINNLRVEAGPTLMIDCPPFTLYLIMNWPRETKIWRNIIREEAHNNGMSLKNQQLTKDNVPVLVDKCINFIYTHGSMSEGVYRKSGSENQVAKLLASFREDAFSVQLTRTEYSEHDVATALKRFMRDLPEPLLGKYTVSFLAVSALENVKDKFLSYAELLKRLATIEYQTLRKLLGHLNFIQSQKAKNKMGTENLAMLWGPTLLADKQSAEIKYSTAEASVMNDLIGYYKQLFHPTREELEREAVMLTVLQKYHAAAENLSDTVKKSGDLKVWIRVELEEKKSGKGKKGEREEENLQVSVTLTPTKTVHDVLRELREKIKVEPYQCALYEVILDETLERPLHYTEKLLDTVLRWTYWADADKKTNCLAIRSNKFGLDVERALKNMATVNPLQEMRFADAKSKAVKVVWLELKGGNVNVLKREKGGEIKNAKTIELKNVLVFLGCEKKREAQSRWGITLVEKGWCKRTRESPFVGHLIAGDDFNDQTIWYSCILYSLYGNDLMPTPEILE